MPKKQNNKKPPVLSMMSQKITPRGKSPSGKKGRKGGRSKKY